jgi:hypothetical protein
MPLNWVQKTRTLKRNISYKTNILFGFEKTVLAIANLAHLFFVKNKKPNKLNFCAFQIGVLRTFCASRSAQSKAQATGVWYFYFDDG